ncbi:MAG: serpin family protein [Gemmatimonadetes bacterium]|nr:serpin family protein [Gemmatimonadota bacterium]
MKSDSGHVARVRALGRAGAMLGLLSLGAVGCDSLIEPGPADPIDELPRPLTMLEEDVIRGSNRFGFELLAHVAADDPNPNVVLSPLSASMALGMTLNGAVDGTFDAMRSALGFDGMTREEINQAYAGLIDLLVDLDPSVRFEIANAIWASASVPFHQAFFDAVVQSFDARVESADFTDPTTLEALNGWVSEKTDGNIPKILDQLDPELVMLLLNAIYFDGRWTTQFDPQDTRPGTFTRPDGSEVTVDMMSLEEAEIRLGGAEGFQVAELPYGGGAYGMVIVLPWEGDARGLASSMTEAAWNEGVASLQEVEADRLEMPKFTVSYDVFLNRPLADMGMEVAFGPGADFSGMGPQGAEFCIDFVRQKTFIEVDEAGTKAAAVTAVGIGPTSFLGMIVDRPFVFAIRERLSGTILFSGVIEDPTAPDGDEAEQPASQCR